MIELEREREGERGVEIEDKRLESASRVQEKNVCVRERDNGIIDRYRDGENDRDKDR